MTPTCSEIDALLEAYVDGDLSLEEKRKVGAHLSACSACLKRAEVARLIADELRQLPPEECPEKVTQDVLRRVRAAQKSDAEEARGLFGVFHRRFSYRFSLGLAAALLIVVVFVGYPLWKNFHGKHPTYSAQEIAQAKSVIFLAFGQMNHATDLAQKMLERDLSPEKALLPIHKGLSLFNQPERKGDKS
jgi:anti-sigma factor RsiW